MLAPHAWVSMPSPRRGFTMVAAARRSVQAPVVVAVHDSVQAVRLFRSALDEAMSRSRPLVVLDYGAIPLESELADDGPEVEVRQRRSLRALVANSNVEVLRVPPDEGNLSHTLSYCEETRPSLLVLGADHVGTSTIGAKLARRIFHAEFDVLVITDHPSDEASSLESAGSSEPMDSSQEG